MSEIIVVAADAVFAQRVRNVLARPDGDGVQHWERPLANPADVKALADRSPAAVILGPKLGKDAAFGLAAHFERYYPAISVLVVAVPGPDTWQRALNTGARAVISPVASDSELRSDLLRAVKLARSRIDGATTVPAASRARVVTVISPKGGSGKTMVSINLAVGLAARSEGNAVLLDLDLQFGDASYALGLKPKHTFSDAVSTLDQLDITTLKVFLTRHTSGLHVLCAPDDPVAGDVIPASAITTVIGLIASQFAYVVIDTPAGLPEHTLSALEKSTDIVAVSDTDTSSVRNLRKALDALDLLGMRAPTRYFVLNRAGGGGALDKSRIATAARSPIDLEIPDSRYVPLSMNEGRPLLLEHPRLPVTRRLTELVELIANAPARTQIGRGGSS
jgi:pilus assembly protein CpaE